ncbi:hypothetical protein AWC38_SpisGene17691 [Stylophora pistillata]|uniref:Uncharacterized protein n=1 Tax=Stylophora pistillata TaxID=50429 RepID=A0A2B4RMA8_STYPI|nr:hypothetical protein AWC38_SpisGene17691 [Stylophora pistillata]
MEEFRKSVYLLTRDETRTLTLSEFAGLRKGERYKRGVTFHRDMTDVHVRGLLESLFYPILSNKRFSCASREGQTSDQFNFHGIHRVWDGRTIKRNIKGQSALYVIMEDELVLNLVSSEGGPPSSIQGHSPSTSFCHNFKNGKTVSLTQTPQSVTTVTSMNIENAKVETTQWEHYMNSYKPGWIDDNLNVPNSPDMAFENIVDPLDFEEQARTVKMISRTPQLTNGNQEQSELQNQLPSTSTDAFQSDDSAFSSSEEIVSQNGMSRVQGTTQGGGVTKTSRKRIKLMGKDLSPNYIRDSSGQSDSGNSSEASTCQAETLNRPKSLRVQEARMKPSEGTLQGGGIFRAEIDEELPPSMATGWAYFGNNYEKVRVTRDGLAMLGEEIPRGDAPGPVTVTFTTLNGDYVAKAIYTYKKFENSTTEQISRVKRSLDKVEESVKRLRSVTDSWYESDESARENYPESVVTEAVKDQLVEEGYFGDVETSDTEEASEDEDSDLLGEFKSQRPSMELRELGVKSFWVKARSICFSLPYISPDVPRLILGFARETTEYERIIQVHQNLGELLWKLSPTKRRTIQVCLEVVHPFQKIHAVSERLQIKRINLVKWESDRKPQDIVNVAPGADAEEQCLTSPIILLHRKAEQVLESSRGVFCVDSPFVCDRLKEKEKAHVMFKRLSERYSVRRIKTMLSDINAEERSLKSLNSRLNRRVIAPVYQFPWHLYTSSSGLSYAIEMLASAPPYEDLSQMLQKLETVELDETVFSFMKRFVKLQSSLSTIVTNPVTSAQVSYILYTSESAQVPFGLFHRQASHLSLRSNEEENASQSILSMIEKFALPTFCKKEMDFVIHLNHSSSEGVFHPTQRRIKWLNFISVSENRLRKQLELALDSKRLEFSWFASLSDEEGFLCPACCQENSVSFVCAQVQGYNQGECVHLWFEFEHSDSSCIKNVTAKTCKDPTEDCASWTGSENRCRRVRGEARWIGDERKKGV